MRIRGFFFFALFFGVVGALFCALFGACQIAGGDAGVEASYAFASGTGVLGSTEGTGGDVPPVDKKAGPDRISFMTWNTQHFFDAEAQGTEFSDFLGAKSRWSAEKYSARLDRLREGILLCGSSAGEGGDKGPDVVVLEEIENARVIEDLCNRLPQRSRYRHLAFVPPGTGSAFSSAVLSRFPIKAVTAHSVFAGSVALRPLLEVTLDASGRPFTVFVAHWKSKVGDADSTDIRSAQERLLYARITALESSASGAAYTACGDFNQTRGEFALMDDSGILNCWDDWFARCESGLAPGPKGSYYYEGAWETIDHFFCPPSEDTGYEVADFRVVATPPLTGLDQLPARYEVYNGSGYSDHLPLVLVLKHPE